MQHDYPRSARHAARGDRARRAARLGADVAGGRRVPRRARRRRSSGTGATTPPATVELRARGAARDAGAAAARLPRAAPLRRARPRAASSRPRWPCSRPAPRSSATGRCSSRSATSSRSREAMLRAELGDRDGRPARARRTGPAAPRRSRGAVVLAKLQLADGDWRGRARDGRRVVGASSRRRGRRPPCRRGWSRRWRSTPPRTTTARPSSLERALDRAEPGGLRSALLDFGRSLAAAARPPAAARHRPPGAGRRAAGGARRRQREQPAAPRRSWSSR